LRLARHHLQKLGKLNEKGARDAHFVEKSMQDILALVPCPSDGTPPAFPRVLSLEQQGRFALGFYQQKAHEAQARADAKAARNSQQEPSA
jgi:CRISPR-associated protein Csd1